MAAGPSIELDQLFNLLPGLDRGELFALAGAHHAKDPAREDAWKAAHRVVTAAHVERELDQLRSEVGAWATHLGSITGQEAGSGMSDLPMADARRAAAPAVLDAAVAFLLGPRLPERDRAALLRPWRRVFAK
jgi:hypothetical protein